MTCIVASTSAVSFNDSDLSPGCALPVSCNPANNRQPVHVNHFTVLSKSTVLIVLASLFGGIVAYSHPDWFHRRPIQITHRFHPFGGRFDAGGVAPLMFEFDRKLKITSIEVLPLSEALTNKSAHPLWHLVSESNSVPTRGFLYGMEVPGMRSAQNGRIADPLDPNERYRLVIQAGSLKGEHDFDLDPSPH